MLPSHEEHISSLFKFEQFLNEVKYQHFWDLHWLQRSFWTLELPKECLALSLLPKPIPTYFTGLPSQSWPAWEAWRGVKILADAGRNQLPHCRVTHATALCWQEHRCAGSKPWSGWVIQMSTRAAPEGTYVLGVVHKVVQPLCPWRDDLRGLCYGCPALWLWTTVPCHGKSFHLSAPRESCPPCLTFLLSFSKPRDALITNSRILWFVPKVPEIRADMGSCGGDGIWRLANLKAHFIAYLIPLRGAEVAWILSDLPSLEEKIAFVETNYFWNQFQYLTSHTGTKGQLLQDTQLHRGLGNCDFIKHWSQPTFMYCQEGCPALWCCPWPQHASHNFPFTSLLCPWPTLCQSRELNQHRAFQVLCHRRFLLVQFPAPACSRINT